MSNLPKVKNYEVKIRIKNHDLPQARISNKTINFNLHKVRKITKINCRELSTVTSAVIDIHSFRKKERQGDNQFLTQTFIHFSFSYPNCCTLNSLAKKNIERFPLTSRLPHQNFAEARFVYSTFIYLFIYLFIHSFIYLFTLLSQKK